MQNINILDLETVTGGAAEPAPPAPAAPAPQPASFCKYLAAEGSRLIRNRYNEKGNMVLGLAGKCWNWNRTLASRYED